MLSMRSMLSMLITSMPVYPLNMAADLTIIDALTKWVGSQRWFVGGKLHPRLTLRSSVSLCDDDEKRVLVLVVSDDGGAQRVYYQVPVVLRRLRLGDSNLGFIGEVDDENGVSWFAYDGPEDPAFTSCLLTLLVDGGAFTGDRAQVSAEEGKRPPYENLQSRVLRGEQSNTSIVYSSEPDSPLIICKIFRMLHHGENPDVVLQSALYAAGSTSVPAIVGSVIGEWPNDEQPNGRARGHLAFAQHFLTGAEDGWKRALDTVSDGRGFSEDARRIGVATADIHATLAKVMPTRAANEEDIAQTVIAWQRRLDAAIAEVPELESLRRAIEALYSRAETASWPPLQSIHGDLHLGQVLGASDGVWTIIDFEGEPLRPLAERSDPDLPLRDIAGMLRSFDYVAGSHMSSADVLDWARSCREAFLDGYVERSGNDVRQNPDLLDAFELDKALYEVVYEARNRPAWLPIPLAAVRRLAIQAQRTVSGGR